MPECARCGDFTDNKPSGQYNYCDVCLDRFAAIEANGVVIEQSDEQDGYQILVTAPDSEYNGGTEPSQTEALARGKYIADNENVDAVFKYSHTGSIWELDEFLKEHPDIRQDVHERLRRVPERLPSSRSILGRIRDLF
ncbi:hypothetical protein ACFOZ7_09510 [Natribaculum luteum]|uniref:Uncharacterized protein n=1 Tax=Natribaculum luteum TaxID=1586232 RepID=A0ABD5NZP8_9EURY|nr:hypothetical protein [Natribaculum luteum]